MEQLFGVIPDWLAGPLIITALAGGAAWLTALYHCVHKQSKRGWRQSMAILAIARYLKDETERLHPKDKLPDIAKTVDTLLKDEDGKY